MADSNAQIIYGEATKGSLDSIIDILCQYGLDKAESHFVDIGSGFGKPVFHAAARTRARCYGLEIVQARVDYCNGLLERLEEEYKRDEPISDVLQRIEFIRVDAGNIHRYQNNEGIDATHIYSFNKVMSPEDNQAIVDGLNDTTGFRVLAWNCNGRETIEKFGLKGAQLVR
jgi:hypothetical protein